MAENDTSDADSFLDRELLPEVAAYLEETNDFGPKATAAALRSRLRNEGFRPQGADSVLICDRIGVGVEKWRGRDIPFHARMLPYESVANEIRRAYDEKAAEALKRAQQHPDGKRTPPANNKGNGVAKKQQTTKLGKGSADVETLTALVKQYEQVFGEVEHFIKLIGRQEDEISERRKACFEAKGKYEAAKDELQSACEARDGTKHSLFVFLRPGPADILPLFDRMEPADEEKHGAHSDEWRKEPVAALRLSLVATNVLTAADVIFVGQLQDRVQAEPGDWWEKIEGLTAPMAAAIADKLNDFITEHSAK